MKKIIIYTLILLSLFWKVYWTNIVASLRKSDVLPWQWTDSLNYDQYNNVWDSYMAESDRFSCVSWLCSWTSTTWVVYDNITKLYWQFRWDWTFNYNPAVTYCNNLVLWWFTDWRLPNLKELHSILAFNNEFLRDISFYSFSWWHWTSTNHPYDSSKSIQLDTSWWKISYSWKWWWSNVRCVRNDPN